VAEHNLYRETLILNLKQLKEKGVIDGDYINGQRNYVKARNMVLHAADTKTGPRMLRMYLISQMHVSTFASFLRNSTNTSRAS